MLIKNLVLVFDHAADGQLFFKTETGEVVTLSEKLLPDFDKNKRFFLNLDGQPISVGEIDSKKILNDLLDSDEASK